MKICAFYDGRSITANGEVMKFAMIMEDCKYILSHGISPVPFLSMIFALSLGPIPIWNFIVTVGEMETGKI